MKRITLVLGVMAVMVVMLVALAAPAMAKPMNGGHHNNGRHLGQVHKKLNHLGKDRSFNRFDRPFNQFDRPFDHHVIFNPGFRPII
jgi:hypothetical protein